MIIGLELKKILIFFGGRLGNYLILFGGKFYDYVTMVELMKNNAIKLDIEEDKILLNNKYVTTHENALFTKVIVEEYKFKSIIVVTF